MSTKTMPPIPPRPTRGQDKHSQIITGSSLGSEMPKIPPRPVNRRFDRSQSPHGDRYAPSPLNELYFASSQSNQAKNQVYSSGNINISNQDLPRRPSSVTLPSLGQEGDEYAEVFSVPDELASSPTQTRSIANDLHLHAPKPSLPISSAKQRVSTVTRTDSSQAAALGIGKATSDDTEPHDRALKEKASFASHGSNSTERAPSISDSEHGIPEIGQQVPMYPNAGDVQAPSPAPFATPYEKGIGFHNDGSKPRHHGRRTSARGSELPPGSYGLYGHGIIPNDRFEKLYYEKHPDLLKKETGPYSGAVERGEWALSSDDLNKIVRETASRGSGLGTSPAFMSTPSEQIGYIASEEYAMRMSPRPHDSKAHSNHSQTHVDSPLRKESVPTDAIETPAAEGSSTPNLNPTTVLESEAEDDDVVHIDAPEYQVKSLYGVAGHMESKESLGGFGGTPREEEPSEADIYSAPILAADEVDKHPFGYDLQPAVSPQQERSASEPHQYRSQSASSSRPSSRPVSIHGVITSLRFPLDIERDSHHTPLEDLDEYEPLFPEEEKTRGSKDQEKPLTAADRLKRPDLMHRKFPSQDIWEDAPNSLNYTATVSSPQLPEENGEEKIVKHLAIREGETPEQAFARRQEELAENEVRDPDSFLNREKKPWSHNTDITTRPSKQRFPSRDIWEDTADSLHLTTTVSQPQAEEKDILSPPEERPTTGAVAYHQEKAAAGLDLGEEEGRATTGVAATFKPQVPTRPTKQKPTGITPTSATSSPTDKAAPPLPVKPKPQVPARPAKSLQKDLETAPLTKVTSASSSKSVESDPGSQSTTAAKSKPPVPSRPAGSKIAVLQGGFMSELNKKLGVGPQASKKEEPVTEEVLDEKEKTPLVDARKGRARGPTRRAPAKSPAPVTESTTTALSTAALGFSKPATVWHIHPDDGMARVSSYEENPAVDAKTNATEFSAPALATNAAGQTLHEPAGAAPGTEKHDASSSPDIEDLHTQVTADQGKNMPAVADNRLNLPSEVGDEPLILAAADEPATEDMSTSMASLKPTEHTKEISQESEDPALPLTTVVEKLGSFAEGKEALEHDNTEAEVSGKEKEGRQMPGSFE